MQEFAAEELVDVFRRLQQAELDVVLVGGQAVNLWACRYDRGQPEWRDLRPYTSRDLDFHGGLAEARLAIKALGATGRLNTSLGLAPNAGVLQVLLGDQRTLTIDILTVIYGVSSAELERSAISWSGTGPFERLSLRVIHPLLLLEGKVASLRGLAQTGRQDEKHVRIMIRVVRQWLLEQLDHPRAVFRAIERLAACAAGPDGLHAFAQGLDLAEAWPLEEMRACDDYADFFGRRWPQIIDRIDRKRQRHLEALGE
jgi:hypothetical protein